jgi:hypothetical protein
MDERGSHVGEHVVDAFRVDWTMNEAAVLSFDKP